MKILTALALGLVLSVPITAKDSPAWQHATVVSQNIGSQKSGAAIVPIGNVLYGVPITTYSNAVILETLDGAARYRITIVETGKNLITLPVNDSIMYYVEKDWYIIVDSKGKKHKFALLHMEKLL